jgi:NAD(P)-dependent dehydrogenase (short-subunit alcohol dehydrogenase family)
VTAARFAEGGATVVVADIDADSANTVAAGLPGAVGVGLDVSDERAVSAAIDALSAGPVDILVNNAAVCDAASFGEISRAAWDRDIAVSLTGSYLMAQAVLPAMTARGAGVIVNVASVNGVGFYGNEAYSAAKAGLLSLTRSLAVGYGKHGIRCNAVVPGTIATPIWQQRVDRDPQILQRLRRWYPLGRVGTPEDVAAAITFLAGDDAGWITGVALPVDGGLLAGNGPMTDDILGH